MYFVVHIYLPIFMIFVALMYIVALNNYPSVEFLCGATEQIGAYKHDK